MIFSVIYVIHFESDRLSSLFFVLLYMYYYHRKILCPGTFLIHMYGLGYVQTAERKDYTKLSVKRKKNLLFTFLCLISQQKVFLSKMEW